MTPRAYILYQFDLMAKKMDNTPKKEDFAKVVPISEVEKYYGTYTSLVNAWQGKAEDKKYVSSELKLLIEKLDRIPLQVELEKVVGRYRINKAFGTYNNLLKENGYMPNKEGVGRKKKTE